MEFSIKNELVLRRLLYLDAFLGSFTGIAGMVYVAFLSNLLGIGQTLILVISAITFGYSIMASFLAFKRIIDIRYTRMLILANWIWSAISLIILCMHFSNIIFFGQQLSSSLSEEVRSLKRTTLFMRLIILRNHIF